MSLLRDQGVGGSNPLSPTNLFNHLSCLCLPCETRAQPSNPLSSDELGAEGLQLPRSDAHFRIIVDSHCWVSLQSEQTTYSRRLCPARNEHEIDVSTGIKH